MTRDKLGEEFSYPMELYFCNDCASVQTQHDVNITDYYQDYQYVASKSKFMTNYMNKLVDYCKDSLKVKENDNVYLGVGLSSAMAALGVFIYFATKPSGVNAISDQNDDIYCDGLDDHRWYNNMY